MADIVQVTDQTFDAEVLKADVPVLVDFWASWCMPCRMQSTILEGLNSKLNGRSKIVKVNTDENTALAQKYKVMSIPTLMICKDGNIVEQLVGVQNEDILLSKLNID